MACNIGRRTLMGKNKSGQQETVETAEWQLWLQQWKMVAADDDGGGKWKWQRWTMTVVDDKGSADYNGLQDCAADYEGEGGEQAVNNNGIRHKAD
jgi:hypothetical protein